MYTVMVSSKSHMVLRPPRRKYGPTVLVTFKSLTLFSSASDILSLLPFGGDVLFWLLKFPLTSLLTFVSRVFVIACLRIFITAALKSFNICVIITLLVPVVFSLTS